MRLNSYGPLGASIWSWKIGPSKKFTSVFIHLYWHGIALDNGSFGQLGPYSLYFYCGLRGFHKSVSKYL